MKHALRIVVVFAFWITTMWDGDYPGYKKVAGPFPDLGVCEEVVKIYNRGVGWDKYTCRWFSDG